MSRKSPGFKIGITLGTIHFVLVALASLSAYKSHSSTAGLIFIWFGFLDAPLSFLLPRSALVLGGPLFFYGVLGSALWFLMPLAMDKLLRILSSKISSGLRSIITLAALPLLVIKVFVPLSFRSAQSFVQSERPKALKSSLGKASSDFLIEQPVFEDPDPGTIDEISYYPCRENKGNEIAVSIRQNVIFLNQDYQEQDRIIFQTPNKAPRMIPVPAGVSNCLYIAETFLQGVSLHNDAGKELWRVTAQPNSAGAPEAGPAADLNGDGKPEFVLFRQYRDGIKVMDTEGKELWTHPIYSLGHVDIVTSGKGASPSIIFIDNSNNANGRIDFTTLTKDGVTASELQIQTKSYEFAILPWPTRDGNPHLLLTEDEKIRIITLDGRTVSELSAPGCKEFGSVRAQLVKFRKDESEYLAVKKSLHPDLSVLYVYSPNGDLVYQKTEVVIGILHPTLAVVPAGDTGTEKLLVGAPYGPHAKLLEYSLKH